MHSSFVVRQIVPMDIAQVSHSVAEQRIRSHLRCGLCGLSREAAPSSSGRERARAAHPDIPLRAIVLVYQLTFVFLMALLAPLLPIVLIVGFIAVAVAVAFAKALRLKPKLLEKTVV